MELLPDQIETLLSTLNNRFQKNMHRHQDFKWKQIQDKLWSHPEKLRSLLEMEQTGGEPDVVGKEEKTGEFVFFDCSAESPKGRRSICYDQDALASRKQHPPKNSALGMAEEMGIELMTEEQYRRLQEMGKFDTKTSSWIKTPDNIRELGGAIFGDWRYGQVFIYHNGADSYYGARGFRGVLMV